MSLADDESNLSQVDADAKQDVEQDVELRDAEDDTTTAENSGICRSAAVEANLYDIIPTVAAPHSTSINSIASTPDLHWVFTGGSDGYIRKFNWIDTANGKSMLTVAQRHPFVDSVTKAGVLASYWENSDAASGKPIDDAASISAVYSLAVQHQALWLLSGLESGGINLQSVRHDEGKRITTLRGHTSAVSVLTLAGDQQSVLSGSWDKTVLDWDLNTGKTIRVYEASSGQIAALEMRPSSNLEIPKSPVGNAKTSQGMSIDNDEKQSGKAFDMGEDFLKTEINTMNSVDALGEDANSPPDSLFGGNDADSLFGDGGPGASFGEEESEFSKAIMNGIGDGPPIDSQNKSEGIETDIVMADAPRQDPSPTAVEDKAQPLQEDQDKAVERDDGDFIDSKETGTFSNQVQDSETDENPESSPETTFLAASHDGRIRIWDKRQREPVARMMPFGVPPWATHATWSHCGDFIYVGRRNGSVDEYSVRAGLHKPARNFKLPNNSGAVSAVRPMPNRRHLVCASFDILRLYDLQEQQIFKHATVPFLIVPGHRTSVVSQLFIDPSCRYLLSSAGNRGWEGSVSEVLLGYEINCL